MGSPFCVEVSMLPTQADVSSFAERSLTFTGSAVERLLHKQRLARRMAKENEHRFSFEDLLRMADERAGQSQPFLKPV
jgi:hypothetical protein